jgi:hypothetical protein
MFRSALLGGALLAVLAAVPAAHATFIKADVADTKIFFNNDADATGHNFTGNVDVNNTGPLVNFNAFDAVDPKNGFSTIKPLSIEGNGDFVRLTIVPTESTWSAFTFRGQLERIGFNGEIDLSVTNQFNVVQNFQFTGLAGPNTDIGDIGISSIDGQRIKSITLTTIGDGAFKELKQFEVQRKEVCIGPDCPVINPQCSVANPCDAPEPASLAILGISLIGMAGIIRYRQS